MARDGQTLIAVGVIGAVAYLFRNQLKSIFSKPVGTSTAANAQGGSAIVGRPTVAPNGPSPVGSILSGLLNPTTWGLGGPVVSGTTPPFVGPGITYKDISAANTETAAVSDQLGELSSTPYVLTDSNGNPIPGVT